jgi:hypothetical protein
MFSNTAVSNSNLTRNNISFMGKNKGIFVTAHHEGTLGERRYNSSHSYLQDYSEVSCHFMRLPLYVWGQRPQYPSNRRLGGAQEWKHSFVFQSVDLREWE